MVLSGKLWGFSMRLTHMRQWIDCWTAIAHDRELGVPVRVEQLPASRAQPALWRAGRGWSPLSKGEGRGSRTISSAATRHCGGIIEEFASMDTLPLQRDVRWIPC
jgi:hypothetical protein